MRAITRGPRFNWRILSLATLALVVAALAILQYRWISELSDAQEIRAVSRLREEIASLADAFDTEVTRAALVFESTMAQSSSRYSDLERAWNSWNQNARWPGVVYGVSLLEPEQSGWRVRHLGAPAASDVRSALDWEHSSTSTVRLRTNINRGGLNTILFVDGHPAFLRPVPNFPATFDRPRMSWILIRFDERYLATAVFPHLLEEYSAARDRAEFQFELKPRATAAHDGNLMIAGVFRYRPDCLTTPVFVSTQPLISTGVSTTVPGAMTHSVPGQSVSLNSLLHTTGRCEIPISESDHGLMELSVRSRHGSLSDVFAQFRKRNEFVSFVVLATLLAALTVVIVSTERARKLAQMQTVVAAGISHELRTPLASLRVAADDLKNGLVENPHEVREYGELIDSQSRRLEHMVNQALAFARSTQSETPPRLCAVSVPDTLDAVLSAMTPSAREAKTELERHIAPGIPRMLADPELAVRCVTNLVENSIKYAAQGGWISLAARPDTRGGRRFVEITVEDRGPGIPEDERRAVFEPFYRGTTARQSRRAGSGLGLAIVKNAMEASGGSIQLEPAVPHGCRFRLMFPAEVTE
jgi:signal transduction histidine kinase